MHWPVAAWLALRVDVQRCRTAAGHGLPWAIANHTSKFLQYEDIYFNLQVLMPAPA